MPWLTFLCVSCAPNFSTGKYQNKVLYDNKTLSYWFTEQIHPEIFPYAWAECQNNIVLVFFFFWITLSSQPSAPYRWRQEGIMSSKFQHFLRLAWDLFSKGYFPDSEMCNYTICQPYSIAVLSREPYVKKAACCPLYFIYIHKTILLNLCNEMFPKIHFVCLGLHRHHRR